MKKKLGPDTKYLKNIYLLDIVLNFSGSITIKNLLSAASVSRIIRYYEEMWTRVLVNYKLLNGVVRVTNLFLKPFGKKISSTFQFTVVLSKKYMGKL